MTTTDKAGTKAAGMNVTGINWSSLTANPMSGCEDASTECRFCYARSLAEAKRGTAAFPDGFDLTFRPHRLRDLSKARSQLVFLNSMSDPGLPEVLAPLDPRSALAEKCKAAKVHVPEGASYFDLICAEMERGETNRYQMLTKRPEAILAYLQKTGRRLPSNVWFGVTIGIQSSAWRLDVAKEIGKLGPALVFLSCEPLLGPLELDLRGVAWSIGGGESGVHATWPERMRVSAASARNMAVAINEPDPWAVWWKAQKKTDPTPREVLRVADKIERRFMVRRDGRGKWQPTEEAIGWARKLRDDCAATGTSFWWKQFGGTNPHSAGRLLDGREHNGMPVHVPGAMPPGYVHKIAIDAAPAPEPRRLEVLPRSQGLGQLSLSWTWIPVLSVGTFGAYVVTADACRTMVRRFRAPRHVLSDVDAPGAEPRIIGTLHALRFNEERQRIEGGVTWIGPNRKTWAFSLAFLRETHDPHTGATEGPSAIYAFPKSNTPARQP